MTNDTLYVITRLHKDDIKQEFPEHTTQIDALTDEDMEYIASKMADFYVEYGSYWDSLREIVSTVLEEKQ